MPLKEIELSKPDKTRPRPYKKTAGEGLYALFHANGSIYWQLQYWHLGKQKVVSLGVYPVVSLKEAREKRFEIKKLIGEGKDPAFLKKQEKQEKAITAANSFEAVAREWHGKYKKRWSEDHAERILSSLEKNVFPVIGSRPIAEIKPIEALSLLRKIEGRGALEIAKRVRQRMGAVFRYAVVTCRRDSNPIPDLAGAIETRPIEHRRHISEEDLGAFLVALEGYGEPITKNALKLLIMTCARTKEIRQARWEHFDLKNKVWNVPAALMKMRRPHVVPLSKQAVVVLKEAQQITGHEGFVFVSGLNGNKPLSENTMLFAIKRMGFKDKTTVHGLRGTASTILNEKGFNPDAIERQLSHKDKNQIRGSYNHAQYLDERKKMMRWWADYLDKVRKDAN